MVSNEDRDAAAKIVNSALLAAERADAYTDLAILAALVSHGWGPKATVRIDRVAECIAEACDVGPATGYRMLTDHLRERGIGLVTE